MATEIGLLFYFLPKKDTQKGIKKNRTELGFVCVAFLFFLLKLLRTALGLLLPAKKDMQQGIKQVRKLVQKRYPLKTNTTYSTHPAKKC